MYIIVGKEAAETVKDRHTLLELETLDIGGKMQTAYCVLAPEVIALGNFPDLERLCRLHQAMIDAWNRGDLDNTKEGLEHLVGKLGADMDTFYAVIRGKLENVETSPS